MCFLLLFLVRIELRAAESLFLVRWNASLTPTRRGSISHFGSQNGCDTINVAHLYTNRSTLSFMMRSPYSMIDSFVHFLAVKNEMVVSNMKSKNLTHKDYLSKSSKK